MLFLNYFVIRSINPRNYFFSMLNTINYSSYLKCHRKSRLQIETEHGHLGVGLFIEKCRGRGCGF